MAETICLRIVFILFISLGLLIVAGHAEDVRISEKKSIKTELEFITIDSDSDFVEIGDAIHLVGKIDESLIRGSPSDTIILISAPEGSLTDTFVLSSPDKNGAFDYFVPADAFGIWGFEALYGGINSPKEEVKVVPSNESGKTALTLSGQPVYPRIGEDISFKGRLTDSFGKGISDRNVTYEIASWPQGCNEKCLNTIPFEWVYSGSAKTNTVGEYIFSLFLNEKGEIFIRVTFQGDDQYSKSESRLIAVTVTDL